MTERYRSNANVESVRGAALPQERVTRALRRALFEEWARVGYRGLRMEQIARRAGVGKAALYRRYPSRLAMASEALLHVGTRVTRVPDTGSLAGDVRRFHLRLVRALRRPGIRAILADLHAEQHRSGELAAVIAGLAQARRAQAGAIFQRAIERGELRPSVDEALALDLLVAPIYWRLVAAPGAIEPGAIDRWTRALLAALAADDGL